ncbi:hypothetical protein L2E82_10531 [Cichorium intybus]|uniref:Uncharacterized protein n=1 Tax=Cichorium intybus TaxID=13427 RepID=A0ACB9GAQ0_CICIN|nr:hypothetical protein L2E82_10531 [Cichorium intybus]
MLTWDLNNCKDKRVYEEVDVNMEWLSIFVEDCLSSSGNCMPPAAKPQSTTSTAEGYATLKNLLKFCLSHTLPPLYFKRF